MVLHAIVAMTLWPYEDDVHHTSTTIKVCMYVATAYIHSYLYQLAIKKIKITATS